MALLNLNRKLNNLDKTGFYLRKKKAKKTWAVRVLVVLIIFIIAVGLPVLNIYSSAKQLSKSGRMIASGVKQENLDQIRQGVKESLGAAEGIENSLKWLFWMGLIPFAGGYYSDMKHFSSAAVEELKASQIITDSLDPYKNELGLVGNVTAGQDRVAQAVKVLDRVLPNIDQVEPNLKKARLEVEGIDIGKYPESFRGKSLRSLMDQAKNFIIGAHVAVTDGKSALQTAPNALGQPSPKTYLLLFQNDKELRPTGGFMTAYTFLKIDKGRLSTTTSDDIYRLDEKLLITCKSKVCPITPPAPIVKYLPEANGKPRSAWSMRDSNISPDLPTSIREFERMYEMLGEGLPFDGVITIDTQVVEELIAVTGPVDVFGTIYSAQIDKRCNCPNVIYELEHYAEVASKGENDRKAVLGTLMQQILVRSLGSGPEKLPAFLNAGVKLASDKHIMFYIHDNSTQQALSQLNWTGQIKSFDGDYLHINDANFAGGKSNLYVEEKVTYDIKINNNGLVQNKLIIEYKNPQPFNTWLNGILRDYVRVYTPSGSKLISSKGSDDPVNSMNDEGLGKSYFEAFIQVRPQNSRTLSFEYTLPNKVTGKRYPLLIQKQPGAKDHHYIIKINGSKKAEFDLTSDKQLNLSF